MYGLHKWRGFVQHSGPGRAFKGLGVAKKYCRMDSIGDSFVQHYLGVRTVTGSQVEQFAISGPFQEAVESLHNAVELEGIGLNNVFRGSCSLSYYWAQLNKGTQSVIEIGSNYGAIYGPQSGGWKQEQGT